MSTGVHQPLREMRRSAGLSLRELERRTGINRGRLSLIERGLLISTDTEEIGALVRILTDALREQRP